jgi:hypothetical protein
VTPGAAPTTSAAGATPAPSSAPLQPKPLIDPAKLEKKTIAQFVAEWGQELESHLKSFTEQSQKVAKWDEELMGNADRVS